LKSGKADGTAWHSGSPQAQVRCDDHDLPVAPNLLERNFTATAPNQLWTSDITYLRLDRDSLEIRHISV
jgi:transposase InsO family protein